MDKDFRRLTDFLVGLGVEGVAHTQKSYLAHLIGVYRVMAERGYPVDDLPREIHE